MASLAPCYANASPLMLGGVEAGGARAFTSTEDVRASKMAHGTLDVAAYNSPPAMRPRCFADRIFGAGISAPGSAVANAVAATAIALGITSPPASAPLALVVIGGALMLPFASRLIAPALLVMAHRNAPVEAE